MKRLLSLVTMSLMLVSCVSLEDSLRDMRERFGIGDDYWRGLIQYKIVSEKDFLIKSLYFSDNCTKCTVCTHMSFLAYERDEEHLIVRVRGNNQLILTKEGSNKAIYKLLFTDERGSCEMIWKNHTRLEKEYIPDYSLSVTMYWVQLF